MQSLSLSWLLCSQKRGGKDKGKRVQRWPELSKVGTRRADITFGANCRVRISAVILFEGKNLCEIPFNLLTICINPENQVRKLPLFSLRNITKNFRLYSLAGLMFSQHTQAKLLQLLKILKIFLYPLEMNSCLDHLECCQLPYLSWLLYWDPQTSAHSSN